MKRAVFYIDGFNLYHSLLYNKHKWLDIKKLANSIISPQEVVSNICYFSALCTWDFQKRAKHQRLIDIYKDLGVEVTLGYFKETTVSCNKRVPFDFCDHKYIRHTEKQTDVNIAIRILKDAYEDKVDRVYLLSRDTDMIPVLKAVQDLGVKTMVLFPPGTMNVDDLKKASLTRKLKEKEYDFAILPDKFTLTGGRVIHRPDEWK